MTYNELAELFKREGGDAQVCFSVISQNQILFGNNDTKRDIISFKNEEPIKWVKEVQEEPVRRTLADIESAMQEIEEKSKAFTEAHQGEDADTILAQMRGEESVNKDLKKAAMAFAKHFGDWHYAIPCFQAGANWQKENLWKPADGNDLPDIDREVIALTQPYTNDERLRVVFAHRPNKYTKVWNSDLGEEQVVEIERHGKGEWNIPDVKWWLDCSIPKEIEL